MCCGGTVPIMALGCASDRVMDRANCAAAARLRAASAPHCLLCGTGLPVLPEVKTIAAS